MQAAEEQMLSFQEGEVELNKAIVIQLKSDLRTL
jgi:hypothetical protein